MKKKNHHPFKIPDGYFDRFYTRLMDSMEHKDAGTAMATIPKSEGFVVPEGYFEKLSEQLHFPPQRQGKRIFLKVYTSFYYRAAAVAALLLLIFGLTWNSTSSPTFDTLSDAELDTYFKNAVLDMNTYEMAEIISPTNLAWNASLEYDVEEDILWDYLNEHIEELNIEYYAYP